MSLGCFAARAAHIAGVAVEAFAGGVAMSFRFPFIAGFVFFCRFFVVYCPLFVYF